MWGFLRGRVISISGTKNEMLEKLQNIEHLVIRVELKEGKLRVSSSIRALGILGERTVWSLIGF